MIIINVNRYFGTPNITKSHVIISDEDGKELMRCEAREARFVDYALGEKVPGSRFFCLARGEYQLRTTSDEGNPICLKIWREPSRRGFLISCFECKHQFHVCKMNLGYADSGMPPHAHMCDIDRCREDFMKVLYEHYGEEIKMVVSNNGLP